MLTAKLSKPINTSILPTLKQQSMQNQSIDWKLKIISTILLPSSYNNNHNNNKIILIMSNFPLPQNLPPPIDDGAANHLTGLTIPPLEFTATDGNIVSLHSLGGLVVIYVYPRTGQPGQPLPQGWDQIPGARGCTPQSCSFSNLFAQFKTNKIQVFGLSSQDTDYQKQAWSRLQLPFVLLSDSELKLKQHLNLPTFNTSGMELYKRLTLVIKDNTIIKVFYPVFPPDKNAEEVLAWITSQ